MEYQKTLEQAISEVVKAAISQALPNVQTRIEPLEKGNKIRGIRELASYLQCSTATAQGLKNRNKIPFYAIGSRLYFYANEIDQALRHSENERH